MQTWSRRCLDVIESVYASHAQLELPQPPSAPSLEDLVDASEHLEEKKESKKTSAATEKGGLRADEERRSEGELIEAARAFQCGVFIMQRTSEPVDTDVLLKLVLVHPPRGQLVRRGCCRCPPQLTPSGSAVATARRGSGGFRRPREPSEHLARRLEGSW